MGIINHHLTNFPLGFDDDSEEGWARLISLVSSVLEECPEYVSMSSKDSFLKAWWDPSSAESIPMSMACFTPMTTMLSRTLLLVDLCEGLKNFNNPDPDFLAFSITRCTFTKCFLSFLSVELLIQLTWPPITEIKVTMIYSQVYSLEIVSLTAILCKAGKWRKFSKTKFSVAAGWGLMACFGLVTSPDDEACSSHSYHPVISSVIHYSGRQGVGCKYFISK